MTFTFKKRAYFLLGLLIGIVAMSAGFGIKARLTKPPVYSVQIYRTIDGTQPNAQLTSASIPLKNINPKEKIEVCKGELFPNLVALDMNGKPVGYSSLCNMIVSISPVPRVGTTTK